MRETIVQICIVVGYVVVLAVVLALPIMLLWNWLMPDIFGLCTINFWQALGISLLSECLFRKNNRSKGDKDA